MSKLMKLIHGSKNAPKTSFINNMEAFAEAYDRFARQNSSRNIFYVVLNGIAMPIAF